MSRLGVPQTDQVFETKIEQTKKNQPFTGWSWVATVTRSSGRRDHARRVFALQDDNIGNIGLTNACCHDLKRSQDAAPALRAKLLPLKVEGCNDCNAAVFLAYASSQPSRRTCWHWGKGWRPLVSAHRAKYCTQSHVNLSC